MEPYPQFRIDRAEMQREWRVHRQRQYQYRLAARSFVRFAIWLLSVYVVRQWSVHAVPVYLLLSIAGFVVLSGAGVGGGLRCLQLLLSSALGRGGQRVGHRSQDAAPAGGDMSGDSGAEEEGAELGDEAGAAAAAVRHRLRNRNVRRGGRYRGQAAHAPAPAHHRGGEVQGDNDVHCSSATSQGSPPLPAHGSVGPAEPMFDGRLSQQQQRALLMRMQQLGTPGATRCAMDAAFRCSLMVARGDAEKSPCPCGSGEKFAACCADVGEELARVLAE